MSPAAAKPWPDRWQRFASASVRGFHSYANWLIGISWRRFALLSLLLMLLAGLLQNIPPFSWHWTRSVRADGPPVALRAPPAPAAPGTTGALPVPPAPPPATNTVKPADGQAGQATGPDVWSDQPGAKPSGVEITIDEHGVRIVPKHAAAASAPANAGAKATAAATATTASAATASVGAPKRSPPGAASANSPAIDIRLPPGTAPEAVRAAVADARRAIDEAVREAQQQGEAARAEAMAERDAALAEAQVEREAAKQALAQAAKELRRRVRTETHEVSLGEWLPSLAMLWIVASAIIKVTYKRQIQAEAQAAQAVETAEAESLRRQVLEARMAAMQAQVEPHFLFNTLASIDHLIEVDPQRASQMQKNLIALLRASMPTMREASDGAGRDLGRELTVIRPYLEILKVRMEERLTTDIDVPEGLQSAEFPAMMVQTLVENAIKHGLEPKPEGGHLLVKAEVLHGKLAVTVADTGLGFGRAATAGTGVGLANIRERLQLLYGSRAGLTIAENPGGGTRVTVSVPYKPVPGAA